jgi:hypothetical protein
MTPIADRISASLRLASLAMLLSSSKMDVTKGWRTAAVVPILANQHHEACCQKVHTLAAGLHRTDDTTPGVHDALAQSNNIVEHLVGAIVAGGDGRSLLQYLGPDGKVGLKVAANGASNIAKALKNGRLELIGKGSAL